MSNMRLGPWDLNRELWDQMDFIRQRDHKTWRFMLTEACRLFIASRGLVPHAPVESSGERYAHAPNVDSVPNPAPVYTAPVYTAPAAVGLSAVGLSAVGVPAVGLSAVGVPAVGLSAVGVPVPELTENEKRLERLIGRRATKQAFLDEAPIELAREPGSLRALNWLKVMPKEVASYDEEIEACKAAIEAERLAKENTGEMERGEEV